ncbi:MAG: hypothetical protein CSA45_01200 [Gammaproteobacteria bacterium]|nr:MAG: hypothetical protein CSA45_01200 [Gammaproteobacteria bacterium]
MIKGYLLLLLTSLLWGTAFIFQKDATHYVDTFTFNFLRFGVSVPALLVLKGLPEKLFSPHIADVAKTKQYHHTAWFIGGMAGFFMFLGISLQQWGLSYTSAGKSGFLTSLYIVIVPILAFFIGQRCRLEVWIGAAVTISGIYLLGSNHSSDVENQFNTGDMMTIACAFAWAAQVLWLGVFARYANVLNIAIIQMLTVTLLSGLVIGVMWWIKGAEHTIFPTVATVWEIRYGILYTGIISAAVAFTLQIFGQRYVPATNAALIMSTEAVFALLAGMIFLGETLTLFMLFGCLLILVGIILAQLQGKLFRV